MSILKEYHAELVKVRPEAAETMPFDTLVKDVAVAFNLFWYARSLPPSPVCAVAVSCCGSRRMVPGPDC